MAKGMNSKKSEKKEATKTPKEKKEEKKTDGDLNQRELRVYREHCVNGLDVTKSYTFLPP